MKPFLVRIAPSLALALALAACGQKQEAGKEAGAPATAPYRVYVTNEISGEVTVIEAPVISSDVQ